MSYRPRHAAPTPDHPARRRSLVVGLALAASLAVTGVAAADPDFGPGNSSKGPQDGKCHPPGQVLPSPECKE